MRCSDRAAAEFAARQAIRHPRVTHKTTGAPGDLTDVRATPFHGWDTNNPWGHVNFDDGLTCWVPLRDLEEVQS